MSGLTSWLKNLLRQRSTKRSPSRTQLTLETLEQRVVPTAPPTISPPGFVSGVVFADGNANGVRDAGEMALPGVPVILSNGSVQLTVNTDSAGRFSFRSVVPGTYSLKAGPLSTHATLQRTITVTPGADLNNNALGFTAGMPPLLTPLPHGPVGPAADHAPVNSHALGTMSLPQNTTGKLIDLAGFFTDADYTNSQVQFNLSVNGLPATLTLNLFDAKAPQTVASFFDYINSGAYNNVFFNSLTKPGTDGFGTLRGGTVKIDATGTQISAVPIGPSIPNEFSASNLANTIAMGSTNGSFYFNTTNNASSLDSQHYTVFGQLTPDSVAELAALAATPVSNFTSSLLTHNFPNTSFNKLPLNNYSGSAATFPGDASRSNYLVINSIDVLKRDEALTYSVVSNSNPGLVTPSITNEFLTLNAVPGHTGTAKIVVRATDLFGLSVTQTLTVKITAAPAVTSVPITPDNLASVGSLTANPVSIPATGVTFSYQWYQNGFAINTVQFPSAATATLSLSGLTVVPGDNFTVKVTPKQTVGLVTTIGATFTSDPVTVLTVSPNITMAGLA